MSSRRRVLYLGLVPPHPGGSAIWASELIPQLRARGHEIIAVAPVPDGVRHDDAELERANVVVEHYPVPYFDTDPFANADRSFYERQTRYLLDLARRHMESGWAECLLIGNETFIPGFPDLARRAGIPTIAMAHTIYWATDDDRRHVNFGPGGVFESLAACDHVVCVARHAEAVLRSLGLANVTTIHNAVDLARFSPRPRRVDFATMNGIPGGATIVTHVANLKPVKEAWRLVEAAPKILKQYPQAIFLLMGQGQCEADLRARRARLGLEDHIRFLGWVQRRLLPDFYAVSDAMALPSASEGAPFAYMEALVGGCPVVSTPIDAAREFLTHIPGAFIAKSHEPWDIADAVCDAIAYGNDHGRRSETARAAAARFDVNGAADRLSALIESARCRC
jgi:glycosyltransferase involved in cell wall biosynthesis